MLRTQVLDCAVICITIGLSVTIPWACCRLCDAMGGAEKVAIPWGNHSLSNRVQEAVRSMINFIKKGGPKGWDDPWG